MSHNQSRSNKSETPQYRKTGRPSSCSQQRGSGQSGWGKSRGGGAGATGPPPTNSSPSNRIFTKSNNAQGVQARAVVSGLNSESSHAAALTPRSTQDGACSRPPLQRAPNALPASASVQPTHSSIQKATRSDLKTPSSDANIAVLTSDKIAPITNAKVHKSSGIPYQFGSFIPPSHMQIPARTTSAPPNIDEQKVDQARHKARDVEAHLQRNGPVFAGQPNCGEAHSQANAKKEMHVSSIPTTSQPSKSSIHSMPMTSMQISQPSSVQFGGHIPQIHLSSMPLSAAQMIMPQHQNLGFNHQMVPPLGNSVLNISSQFPEHGGCRRPVKITYPNTKEELRLDKPAEILSFPSNVPVNYCNPNPCSQNVSYPPCFPMTCSHYTHTSQAPTISYPVSQAIRTAPCVKSSTVISLPASTSGNPIHAISESLNIVPVVSSVVPSPIVHVPIKPATAFVGENVTSISLPTVGKNDLHRHLETNGKYGLNNLPRVPDNSESLLQQLKPNQNCPLSVSETFPSKTMSYAPVAIPTGSPGVSQALQTVTHVDTSTVSSLPVNKSRNPIHAISESLNIAPVASPVPSPSLQLTTTEANALVEKKIASISQPIVEKDDLGMWRKTNGGDCLTNFQRDHENLENSQQAMRNGSLSCPKSIMEPQIEPSVKVLCQAQQVPELPAPASSLPSTALGFDISVNEVFESTKAKLTLSSIEATVVRFESSEPVIGHDVVTESRTEGVGIDCKLLLESSDEHLKYAAVGGPELKDVMLPEGFSDGGGLFLDSISTKSLDNSMHIEKESVLNIPSNSNEVCSLETVQRKVKKPAGGFNKDDGLNPNLVVSTTFPTHSEILQSNIDSLMESDTDGKSPGASLSGSNTLQGVVVSVVEPIIPDSNLDAKKPPPELGRSKSLAVKGKKKMREILQKADAAGSTSDLYNAYKGPKDKRETAISFLSMETASSFKQDVTQEISVAIDEGKDSKLEPDDWEDAADIATPKLESSDCMEQVHEVINHNEDGGVGIADKKYTRDFLVTLSDVCMSLPHDFNVKHDLRAFIISNSRHSDNDPVSNDERIKDRQLDRRENGVMDVDKWKKSHGPTSGRDARMENGFGGNNVLGFRPGQGITHTGWNPRDVRSGLLPGPPMGMQKYGSDVDRWSQGSHKGLIPPPLTPSVVMHKAEKKYEVGKITDEEQAKQRQLKSILNKLTPQNFEKLFEQVKAVNIDKAVTLTGTISQIFDKALMEPTFCEMYANFCSRLAGELPVLENGDDKITFKRLLLNKCQEEFERGEREQEEADRVEDGEIKLTEAEKENKRLKARRRMLGNIRLIGELYKKRMLTERIMHDCIQKLLCQLEIPEEEDIEALCKLMSTIGEMIDHTKAKEHIDFYFERMGVLSNNMGLSSRVRFMLKDSIDLRMNKWQQRRKIDGPKMIDEVHRDAVQERQAQVSRMTRNPPPINPSPRKPMEYSPRGPNILHSLNHPQTGGYRGLPNHGRVLHPYDHGFGIQDVRSDDRPYDARPLSFVPQRPILGPQGGLAKEMSFRAQSSISTPIDEVALRYMPERIAQSRLNTSRHNNDRDKSNQDHSMDVFVSSTQPTQPENAWSEDRMRLMSIEAIKEFYSVKDEDEVSLCMKDLNSPGFHPTMIYLWVMDSFERKEVERQHLAQLLVNLTNFGVGLLTRSQLILGLKKVVCSLEDAMHDAPKAAQFLGRMFGKMIKENVIPFKEIEGLISICGEKLADQLHEATMGAIQSQTGS